MSSSVPKSQIGISARQHVIWGADILRNHSESARLDSELLLAHALSINRVQLHTLGNEPITLDLTEKFIDLIKLRETGKPIAYIVGKKEFFGLEFLVCESVLVPRPETEILVEQIVQKAIKSDHECRILDLGTGSGAIAVSVAHTLKNQGVRCKIIAVDISQEALAVAKTNAMKMNVAQIIEFYRGSWFEPIQNDQKFDIICTNPPYVDINDSVPKDLLFEPPGALFAQDQGLRCIVDILSGVYERLAPGGVFLSEIGQGQDLLLKDHLPSYNWICGEAGYIKDLAGINRILVLQSA